MTRTVAGEMPFLDHLEELRSRILRVLGAVIGGTAAGIWAVDRFRLIDVLKAPIAPYLPDGRLTILSPTEPVMAVLKLGFIVGLVLASPVIVWQVWAFLSPALYEKEKKAIVPSLFAGLVLFLGGAAVAFLLVVPKAIAVLLSIGAESFSAMITYDKYFGLVTQLMLGMGLSFELPLVLITLSGLGVVTPRMLSNFRRYWIVAAFVLGALISPGPDLFSMMLMTIPLLFLYEVGVAGSLLIARRRARAAVKSSAGLALLVVAGLLAGGAGAPLAAQQGPGRQPGDTLRDSVRVTARDSAAARRLGLPRGPSRTFAPPDSVMRELMQRAGVVVTRFRSDSALLEASEKNITLRGSALTERSGAILEAERINYRDADCLFTAAGNPKLFQQGSVAIGDSVRFDTCIDRGVLTDALTTFQEQGANWFIRGNLAVDSVNSRLYAAAKEITSCDLPESHYHFAAREVKWVSRSTMVARPAVLYIRDVPVLWLPFIFQDTKSGRRSGILIPQFGLNDIVRPNRNFNRQVTNVGFYWAANDYFDALFRLDWLANRYTQFEVGGQYRWLDQFMSGRVSYSRQIESGGGGGSTQIAWNHNQQFGLSTRLTVQLSLATSTRIINRNAIDPRINTETIQSSANYNRRFSWGTLNLGGNRRQDISSNSVTTGFPTLAVSPKPVDLGNAITWSPNFSINNTLTANDRRLAIAITGDTAVDTLAFRATSRTSVARIETPFRFGSFNLPLSINIGDRENTDRRVEQVRIPNLETPEPNDSVTISRIVAGDFQSEIDWTTGINLPTLFRGTLKLVPGVSIENVVPGSPFRIRNTRTGGEWVQQGKRLSWNLNASPTLYGFFPGAGPVDRIRHAFSPTISYAYSPEATVDSAYARAITPVGGKVERVRPPSQRLTLGLSQNFEAKGKPEPGDSTGRNARKFRLLSISTSPLTYDFEQAKLEGRTGWATQSISNTFQSDLLQGFDLSLSHNLWRGAAGTDTAQFEPFLESVGARFSLTGNTFRSIGALLGLTAEPPPAQSRTAPTDGSQLADQGTAFQSRSFASARQFGSFSGGGGFSATVNLSISRVRPPAEGDTLTQSQPTRSTLGFSTRFSPTTFWTLSWDTQYNVTDQKFESHILRLQRDLHDWRAAFNFSRSPNGNFSFYFSVNLIDLPDLKFDYNQSTVER